MFDDKFFEQWLDNQAQRVMNLVAEGKAITPEEMMVLVLKAQTNHFAHLDIELREEIQGLREDMDKRFDLMREEMSKRFEQVDKRFEQFDKRFEILTTRIDHFMVWSFATTLTVGGIVIAAIKFLP
jgi:hypothetical protein